MKKLAIIGAGDLSEHIAYYAEEDNHYNVVGFFDDFKNAGDKVGRFQILGKISDILKSYASGLFDYIIIGIGYKHFSFRKYLYEYLNGKIAFGKIIHSSSYVSTSCKISDGVVILPNCTLDKNVIIEANVFLNISVSIAHDSVIKSHSFLSPSVVVAGFVSIGECCNIGINSTIIDNINIVASTQIGGGAVVVKNIDTPGVYVGVPAKLIKAPL